MKAEILKADHSGLDAWLDLKEERCVLRWRPGFFADRVHLDGKLVERRGGLFGRDRTFAFAVKDGDEKRKLLLIVDYDETGMQMSSWNWSRLRGVLIRLEDRTAVAWGSLDPANQVRLGQKLRRFIDDLGLSGPHQDGS